MASGAGDEREPGIFELFGRKRNRRDRERRDRPAKRFASLQDEAELEAEAAAVESAKVVDVSLAKGAEPPQAAQPAREAEGKGSPPDVAVVEVESDGDTAVVTHRTPTRARAADPPLPPAEPPAPPRPPQVSPAEAKIKVKVAHPRLGERPQVATIFLRRPLQLLLDALQRRFGAPDALMKLRRDGEALDPLMTAEECEVEEGDQLDLFITAAPPAK